MKRLLLLVMSMMALCAQDSVSRVVQLRYVHPDSVAAVMDILAGNKVKWRNDGTLRIIAMNGPLELVDAMEAAAKKLDIPASAAKNIESTFHILLAGGQGPSTAVPAELSGVVQQLGNVFGLKSFRVLETSVIRGRDGREMRTSGLISIPVKVDASPQYFISSKRISMSPGEKSNQIRMDHLEFRVSVPVPQSGDKPGAITYLQGGVTTDVDLREGQKVVVGKASVHTTGESIFLVVSAKLVD